MDTFSSTEREIDWDEVSIDRFEELISLAAGEPNRWNYGIVFPTMPHQINVQYYDPGFAPKLKEKFKLLPPYEGAPLLVFVRHDPERFGFRLARKHQGYVVPGADRGLVFAGSFGMFKSAISGFASIQAAREGYVPAHTSVFSINGVGIMFVGGSGAGKTTTLLRLVTAAVAAGASVEVLTDDWAVVKLEKEGLFAESFDPSVSLKQKDFLRSPDLLFHKHQELVQRVNEKTKISLPPSELFGSPVDGRKLRIDAVVVLRPVPGVPIREPITAAEFAQVIVETAYHYPYVGRDEQDAHRAFWKECFSKVRTCAFATRNVDGDFQRLDALQELFHE